MVQGQTCATLTLRHTFDGFLCYTLQASSIWTCPHAGLHLITVILRLS